MRAERRGHGRAAGDSEAHLVSASRDWGLGRMGSWGRGVWVIVQLTNFWTSWVAFLLSSILQEVEFWQASLIYCSE